jgi:hypothetical protein
MIMSYPEESKTGAVEDELAELLSHALDVTGEFAATALRQPTLAALRRGKKIETGAFPSTALREPTLRLAAEQLKR